MTPRCERCGIRLGYRALSAAGDERSYTHNPCPRCGLRESRVGPVWREGHTDAPWDRPLRATVVETLELAARMRREAPAPGVDAGGGWDRAAALAAARFELERAHRWNAGG